MAHPISSSGFLRVSILLQHPKSASATARLLTKGALPELKVSLLFPLLGSDPVTSGKPHPAPAVRAERRLCAELRRNRCPQGLAGSRSKKPGSKSKQLRNFLC